MSDSDASRLCVACGLCCDGMLFDHAPVDEPEADRLRAAGLRLAALPNGRSALPQPCEALGKDGCSIYEQRPGACRRFDCLLVKALGNGEVSLEEALEVVGQVRSAAQPKPLLDLYFHRPAR